MQKKKKKHKLRIIKMEFKLGVSLQSHLTCKFLTFTKQIDFNTKPI